MTVLRRPHAEESCFEDWRLVRAAQYMIDTHGPRSTEIAEIRAEHALDGDVKRRWLRIAYTIGRLPIR